MKTANHVIHRVAGCSGFSGWHRCPQGLSQYQWQSDWVANSVWKTRRPVFFS